MRPPLVILAGGKGTRLGELTASLPKPMIEVYGKPFLWWLLRHYKNQGFDNIIISTNYEHMKIAAYAWDQFVKIVTDDDLKAVFQKDYAAWFDGSIVKSCVVVNGDTFIPQHLPTDLEGPWILSCGDVDAGAQCVGRGKIKVYSTPVFYDMGTPESLMRFIEYCRTHLVPGVEQEQAIK